MVLQPGFQLKKHAEDGRPRVGYNVQQTFFGEHLAGDVFGIRRSVGETDQAVTSIKLNFLHLELHIRKHTDCRAGWHESVDNCSLLIQNNGRFMAAIYII